uniref:HDC10066 n=1 Tax=Drosophila melanogaster TaxID=7227 RepID=Q6IL79_DROME|nr:TPA_inf: HDC10066 [Drosophila melanogaster]
MTHQWAKCFQVHLCKCLSNASSTAKLAKKREQPFGQFGVRNAAISADWPTLQLDCSSTINQFDCQALLTN